MKKLIVNSSILLFYSLVVVILFASCDKDDMQENTDNPDNPQVRLVNPNKATASLIFDNMNVVSGTPPSSKRVAKSTIDLKIDSDTIFWTPGIIKRIKILKPEDVSLSFGVWAYVPGASSYIETSLREEEETDDISILYFDFDPTDWELPITFPLRILPLDEDGNPTDEFEIPVEIEKPHETGGICDIDIKGTIWEWTYFNQDSPSFFTAPMFPHITLSSTLGCCIDGESDSNAVCANTSNERQLDYEIIFMRPLLSMAFTENGEDVFLFWKEYSRNLDPFTSNFCSNSAGYTENEVDAAISIGTIINSDCSISFDQDSYNNSTYMGGGPFIKYNLISDHFMKQTISSSGGSDGGSGSEGLVNMFEKRNWGAIDTTIWFD